MANTAMTAAAERQSAAVLLLPALPALCAVLPYAAVGSFGFVFDDQNALADNLALHRGDFLAAAFGEYTSLSNRPLACASFAVDFALGLGPGAMHLVSLFLHAVNAVLVFAVVRALLASPNLRAPWSATGSRPIALAVACLWAAHPLGADAVAYLTQRSMLLMAMFALLAALSLLRSHAAPQPRRWQTAAVACTALALAGKEEAAALPLLLVLADRAFGAASWPAWRARWRFHAALLATWSVLLACVCLGPANPTVGYATVPPVTAWQWLLTETQVLPHYLRCVLLPDDLRGIYDYAVVRDLGPALLPGTALLALAAAAAWAWRRRPALAFAGAWFFLLLAPTSSVFPILTEPCADRRMYLPLLAVLVPLVVLAARRLPRAWFLLLTIACTIALGATTFGAAGIYRDDATFVAHAAAKNPLQNGSFMAGRILSSHARVLREQGQMAAAHALLLRAIRCEAPGRVERLNYANMLEEQGQTAAAEAQLRAILRDYPDYAEAKGNLAGLLIGRSHARPQQAGALLDEAERLLRRGLQEGPRRPELHNTMGVLLHTRGATQQAVPFLQRALELRPDFPAAARNLGIAWLALDRPHEAIAVLLPLRARFGNDPGFLFQLASAHRQADQTAAALELLRQAVQAAPDFAEARALLQQLERAR